MKNRFRLTVPRFAWSLVLPAMAAIVPVQSHARDGGRPSSFEQMDQNGDHKLSKDEFKGPSRAFSDMDANQDGSVSKEELKAFREKRGAGKSGGDETVKPGAYPALKIKKYDQAKAWPGNVIFVDKNRKRVVEARLDGAIAWECPGPVSDGHGRMSDVELLPNDNVLVLNGGDGVYELDRKGKVVWSYKNSTVSHDADRLPNGNVLLACVGAEKASEFPYKDPQAIEVSREGKIVWAWHARNEYAQSQYKDVRSGDANDWTHMNSVQRLKDGNTLLSVRNWNLLVAVNAQGRTVWKTGAKEVPKQGWGRESPSCPHTPVLLENGNFIVSEPIKGRAIEWDPKQEMVVWSYPARREPDGEHYFVRAAHRLPNGNTFIIDSNGQFLEVTTDGELVWHAQLADYQSPGGVPDKTQVAKAPCFNADRRGMPFFGGR